MVEKFGTNGGKIWYLTSVDLMRAHARAHAHSNTPQTHAHSVGMCLGFYRPQKVLSWAENQKFKIAPIFGTFASFFHGVQYCTFGAAAEGFINIFSGCLGLLNPSSSSFLSLMSRLPVARMSSLSEYGQFGARL